jgi:hypothetical protein
MSLRAMRNVQLTLCSQIRISAQVIGIMRRRESSGATHVIYACAFKSKVRSAIDARRVRVVSPRLL